LIYYMYNVRQKKTMFSEYELRNEDLTSIKTTAEYPVSRPGFGRDAS